MMNAHHRLATFLLACLAIAIGCGPSGESPPPAAPPTPSATPTPADALQAKMGQSFYDFYNSIKKRRLAFAGTTISASDFTTKSTEVIPDPRDPKLWVAQVELSSPQGPGGIVVLYEWVDGRWKFHFDRSFMDIGEGPEPLPRSLAPDEPPALGDVIEAAFHE